MGVTNTHVQKRSKEAYILLIFMLSMLLLSMTPLLILNDFVNSLYGFKIFSSNDLKSAFHLIPVHPDSVKKTCTATLFGSLWDCLSF